MSAMTETAAPYRICDSETMQYKLLYRIHTGQFDDRAMERLQAQCRAELAQLRGELDGMIRELREIAAQGAGEEEIREAQDGRAA